MAVQNTASNHSELYDNSFEYRQQQLQTPSDSIPSKLSKP
ncbi:hypothetical protein HMPREF9419_1294 [Prevotella nigrescens ATCC 33563]|nr:hypothetical protein HMPREF9419_1294 [Prevotella nigrescens ATCC 33563]